MAHVVAVVSVEPPVQALGAYEGDPVVWLRQPHGLQPCYAKESRARTLFLDGRLYEHVAEHDGRWVYAATV